MGLVPGASLRAAPVYYGQGLQPLAPGTAVNRGPKGSCEPGTERVFPSLVRAVRSSKETGSAAYREIFEYTNEELTGSDHGFSALSEYSGVGISAPGRPNSSAKSNALLTAAATRRIIAAHRPPHGEPLRPTVRQSGDSSNSVNAHQDARATSGTPILPPGLGVRAMESAESPL